MGSRRREHPIPGSIRLKRSCSSSPSRLRFQKRPVWFPCRVSQQNLTWRFAATGNQTARFRQGTGNQTAPFWNLRASRGAKAPAFGNAAGTKSPDLGTRCPRLGTKSPDLGTRCPGLGTKPLALGARQPDSAANSPCSGTKPANRGTSRLPKLPVLAGDQRGGEWLGRLRCWSKSRLFHRVCVDRRASSRESAERRAQE